MLYTGEEALVLSGIYNVTAIAENYVYFRIWHFLFIVEIVGIVHALTFQPIFVYVVYTTAAFHKNLRHSLGIVLSGWILSEILRILQIFYQSMMIPITGNYLLDFPLLFASIFRHFIYFCGVSLLFAKVAERAMATYFFADYEKKRRLWIDILLHFFLAIFGEIFAYFYTFLGVYISKKIFCVLLGLILICALLTVVVHHYLYTWNRRKLRSLINQPRLYSLSVRFQLEENCRALKLIRPGVLSHSVVIAVFGLFLGAPLLVFPHGTPTGEFILAITEAMGSLHVIAMQQVILKTVPMYNNTYKEIIRNIFMKVFRISFERIHIEFSIHSIHSQRRKIHPNHDTVLYFQQLRAQWD